MAHTVVVNEIYYSIQGESTWAGAPCVFVRLTGCHLRCKWCDTTTAFHEGDPMELEEIVTRVGAYNCRLVEITGGEPLLQQNVLPLMSLLADHGHDVLLETSGSVDITGVDPRVARIMDLKCPGSGESAANRYANIAQLTRRDEVKFVLLDRGDYDWAREKVREHDLPRRCTVLFSPAWGRLSLSTLAGWILADRLPVRLQSQWHKHIWGPDARGV